MHNAAERELQIIQILERMVDALERTETWLEDEIVLVRQWLEDQRNAL